MDLKGTKIALIFPPYKETRDTISVKENKKHLGKIPPLSLAYIAAILEAHNVDTLLIDASALALSKEECVRRLQEFSPDFLGFTLATYHFHHTLDWIRYLKNNIKVPIVVGGIHTSVYPKETLAHKEIDYLVIGDGEETLPELIKTLLNGSNISQIKGIAYKDQAGNVLLNEPRGSFNNIDLTPFPARHLLPNEKYFSLISHRKNFTAMMTSRGCPFNCIFCDNNTIKFRFRSPENVVDEMVECYDKYDIREIDIFDAAFTVKKDRAKKICEEMLKRQLDIIWSFRTRADLIDKELLTLLNRASCTRIYYGIESASPTILKNIKKEVSIERIKEVIWQTEKSGIEPFGFFMVGNIGETKETVAETIQLIKKLPLKYIQVASIYVPPNTELYDYLRDENQYDFWREYTRKGKLEGELPLYGTSLTRKEIDHYVKRMYLAFYLRPFQVLKIVLSIKSFEEFKRGCIALKDMVVSFFRSGLN
ncbi:B12-binding domain-containing radical SAM protein [Candidatus Auribacterota bacterium]